MQTHNDVNFDIKDKSVEECDCESELCFKF